MNHTLIEPQNISTAQICILVSLVCFHAGGNEELPLCCAHSKIIAEQNSPNGTYLLLKCGVPAHSLNKHRVQGAFPAALA